MRSYDDPSEFQGLHPIFAQCRDELGRRRSAQIPDSPPSPAGQHASVFSHHAVEQLEMAVDAEDIPDLVPSVDEYSLRPESRKPRSAVVVPGSTIPSCASVPS